MSSTSVREAQYQGHHIVIRTTYSVEVDGVRLMGHMGVSNDGSFHYHPIPNMRFDSAIDLVKQIIYVFPDDFSGRSSMGHRGSMNMSGMKHKGGAKTHKTRKK